MLNGIKIMRANNGFREAVVALLQAEKLPVEDLPSSLDQFFIAVDEDVLAGVVGFEMHGAFALLRSLAVKPEYRNKKIASALIDEVESEASNKRFSGIYLLTETAADYFAAKGFQRVERGDVPLEIKRSSEFAHVCPVSAIVMKKEM
jgi:amino-acid N-acetyltransferase